MAAITHLGCLQEALTSDNLGNGELSVWNAQAENKVLQEFHDVAAFLNSIKVCGKQKNLDKGHKLHALAVKSGLLREDIYVGTAFIRMYAKCGVVAKAQEVFHDLPAPDTAAWNALISGYAQHELGHEALHCFGQMQDEGLHPDSVTYLCILKACGGIRAFDKGKEIHEEVSRKGLLVNNAVLGTALVDMYAKCGAFSNAQEVFDELPTRDVATWTALIAGYAQHGLGYEALDYYSQMRGEGITPDTVTFVCILKACGSIGVPQIGEEIHFEICRKGLLETNQVLGSALVDMYARCGALAKAEVVLDELPAQEVASWTALIGGYVQHGLSKEALDCFRQMLDRRITPNAVTFVCVLKACGMLGAIEKGEEIHAEVDRQRLLKENLVLGNAVVDMYAKCGALAKAQHVFEELPARDLASWNALMSGYAQHQSSHKVLQCLQQMQDEGLSPNAVTYVCALKACSSIGAIDRGEEFHAEVIKQGLLKSTALGNMFIDMYAKCDMLARAQQVFDELPDRDLGTWNALISGYAQSGFGDEVLSCFKQMQNAGQTPDAVTFVCILKACGSMGAAERGEDIHEELCRQGLLEENTVLGTALVDMYAKCGMIAKAREVFDKLPKPDVVSWTALIGGYSQHGFDDEALGCFQEMQNEGLTPNVVTFVCILKACGNLGAIEQGKEIHAEVKIQELLESSVVLSRALIDMYANCGMVAKAQELFDNLSVHDVISSTSLLAGYAQLGKAKEVFNLYSTMIEEHVKPNVITFVVLLTACSHAGLVREGQMYFETMCTVYCIKPTLEHYTCMVDLLSRAGLFDMAVSVIKQVPLSNCLLLWSALLSACQKSTNVEFGKLAFEQAVQLNSKYDSAYVCMSNLYAACGMQEEADKIKALRIKCGAWKQREHCWWTDVNRNVHSFGEGYESSGKTQNVLLKQCLSSLQASSLRMLNDGKKSVACRHTALYAIAAVVVTTSEGKPIRVTNNMRMCLNCHSTALSISKMRRCKILVKDGSYFHVFQDGSCICEETVW